MEKALEIIKGRARSEAIAASYWGQRATEEYGKEFPRTNPDGLYTKLWKQSYTRRDMLFEILAEVENVDISVIIEIYSKIVD